MEQLLANVLSKGHDIVNVNAIFAVSRGRILEQLPADVFSNVQHDVVNVKRQVCCSRGRILEQVPAIVLSNVQHDEVNMQCQVFCNRGRISEYGSRLLFYINHIYNLHLLL